MTPAAPEIASCVSASSRSTRQRGFVPRSGWENECTPSSEPCAWIAATMSGYRVTFAPTTKNVAGTLYFLRTASTSGVHTGSGPSSKVSAIVPRGTSLEVTLAAGRVDDGAAVADRPRDVAGAALRTLACGVVAAAGVRDARDQRAPARTCSTSTPVSTRDGVIRRSPHGLRNHRCRRRRGGGRLRRGLDAEGALVFLVGFTDAVGASDADGGHRRGRGDGRGLARPDRAQAPTGRSARRAWRAALGVFDGRSGVTCCTAVCCSAPGAALAAGRADGDAVTLTSTIAR